MSANAYDAVVIGAGHNGLVAAAYLAKAGKRVVAVERREVVGGLLADHEVAPGTKVPAVFHSIDRLVPGVVRDLELDRHGLSVIRPDVRAFVPDGNGGGVTLWGDVRKTAEGLRSRSASDADAYVRLDRQIRSLASFLAHVHSMTPPDIRSPSAADALAGLKLARLYRRMGPKAGRELLRALPMPVADLVGDAVKDDTLRAAVAHRGVRFTSMAPRIAGTGAWLLADSAESRGGAAGGVAFARGGPSALADALTSAARAFGVEIRTSAEVSEVLTGDGRVTGVALTSGEELRAPTVVSSADPKRTLLGFLDPEELGPTTVWRTKNIRAIGCVAKVNIVLAGVPRFAGASTDELKGRVVIAPAIDYLERAADAAKYRRISATPYLEAVIPSLSDPTLASDGTHVMSVVAQWAPYSLREGDWTVERDSLGDLVLKTLEHHAPGFQDLVVAREVLTPVDLERDFGVSGGHVLHGEPGLDQWFAWRPLLGSARYRMPVDGLYLCGSGAHPGGNVTGVPGRNAARQIMADSRRLG
jgi:phytoene dehydrogenase-like protein